VKFIPKFRASGRLLDVGCAYGFFLHEAKRFFDVSGIELAKDAAEHCRRSGLNVFTGQADETLLGRLATTDVIVLLDVIEHLPSPRDTIALTRESSRPWWDHRDYHGDFARCIQSCRGALAADDTAAAPMLFSQASMQAMATSLGLEVEHLDHPWKVVPLSLISFQLTRMSGLRSKRIAISNRLGCRSTIRCHARRAAEAKPMSDRLSLAKLHAHGLCSGRACIRAQASARLLVFAEPLSMRFVIGIVLILCGLFFIAG